MNINVEILIAELCSKLHANAIDPHGPNLPEDLRRCVNLAKVEPEPETPPAVPAPSLPSKKL